MDQLQRERRFVDLFRVVSGSLIASEKGYSIKDLEAFYMPKREADITTAGASVVFYEKWRESGDDELLNKIRDYNRTDCISTQLLRDWLVHDVRPASMPWPQLGEIPEAGALSNIDAEDADMDALRDRLAPVRERLGAPVADLLLDLNFFHKREDKPTWWGIFDRLAQESDELLDDIECIQGLEAVGEPVKVTAKSFERTYRFPLQDTKLRAGKKPCVKPAARAEDVDLRELNPEAGTLVLRRSSAKGALPDRLDLLPSKPVANNVLRTAIAAVTDEIIRDTGRARAIEQMLTRQPPAFVDGHRTRGIIDRTGGLSSEISAAIAAMNRTTLAIQGPPGTGKTYVSAISIVDLVRDGMRVAVSSNSHKAIGNLLEAIAARAVTEGVPCRIVQKSSDGDDDEPHPAITVVSDNEAPEIADADVVGATAWHFARYSAASFDYIFVDEAGQVSLANVVALSRAGQNLVLVGDPMQLPQPLQGTHPGRSGESCLEYVIDGHRVIPPDRGIFMPVTRRMHPKVCSFISTAVYEDRLRSDEAAGTQELRTPAGTSLVGAGVRCVTHFGRSQVSPEEVEAIKTQIRSVLGSTYRDREGAERLIDYADILIVAPYNAQVNALRAALPSAIRVGTVDRFQGQEAPVCLVSMTTSSGEELPRDIEFLFSLNRINVAVSRAQASAMVFASPRLLEIPCRSIREMTLVNALCLLREHGGDSF
jgi:uncharacterized protein